MPKEGCIENAFLLASIRVQQINVEHIPGIDLFTKALPRTKYDQISFTAILSLTLTSRKKNDLKYENCNNGLNIVRKGCVIIHIPHPVIDCWLVVK
jgi:hypothetical protein